MAPTLTLLGLGPGNPEQRTLEAVNALRVAERILLRTSIHPGLHDLVSDPRVSTCDDLYEHGTSFAEVYQAIVDRVRTALELGDLLYAVPGHPLIGERTVTDLLDYARSAGAAVVIVPGVSAIDAVASTLAIDPMAMQAQIVDATELERWAEREPFAGGFADVSPARPVLLTQVYSQRIASVAKLRLSRIFPDMTTVTVVSAAGVNGEERSVTCPLFELDRQRVDHLTSVWIPALPSLEATRWPVTLHNIAARLRAPDGCPWDRKQTRGSLRASVIEEAYEVAAAIDDVDSDHLAEELGDQLLLVAMIAQIADEAGDFAIGDVYDHVNRKLVRRHPHVFGEQVATTPEAVVATWEAVKAAERSAKGAVAINEPADPFDRFPASMPAMMRLAKIYRGESTENGVDPVSTGRLLLELVERLSGAGYDPETVLELAYRSRTTSPLSDPSRNSQVPNNV